MIQLEFFPETHEKKLTREIAYLKQMQEKVRKSQYARLAQLEFNLSETKAELEMLKAYICKERVNLWD